MEYDIVVLKNKQKSHNLKPLIGLTLLVSVFSPLSLSAATWSTQELLVFDLVNRQRAINNLDPLRRNDRLHDAALAHSQSMSDNGFFSHTTLVGGNNEGPGERIYDTGYRFTVGGENIAAGHGRILGAPPTLMDPQNAARHVMYGTADLDEYNAFFYNTSLPGGPLIDSPVSSWNEVGIGVSGGEWNDWHTNRTPTPCDSNFDGVIKEDERCPRDGGWMGSEGHRSAILDDRFLDIGIGYVWDPDDTAPILMGYHDENQIWRLDEIDFPLNTYWTQDFATPVPLPGAIWLLLTGLGSLTLLGGFRKTV
jgi:uncharacterized protein YkwD